MKFLFWFAHAHPSTENNKTFSKHTEFTDVILRSSRHIHALTQNRPKKINVITQKQIENRSVF